jgi:hypothetical protein
MQEEGIPEEEYKFGVLHGGSTYKRRNNGVEKGESCSDPKGREPCTIF